jgi:preprotein translocase subunit SecE
VARNRKRAKERRSRRPTAGPGSRPGVATARAARDAERNESPSPLEHATPDAELADAQLALGRPELAPDSENGEADDFSDGDFDENAGEEATLPAGDEDGSGDGGAAGGALARPDASVPASRRISGGRLLTFLQGSWHELQRVQWPDRRQVMQATGVVIGFVIVAGLFLGLADTVASRLVTFILK